MECVCVRDGIRDLEKEKVYEREAQKDRGGERKGGRGRDRMGGGEEEEKEKRERGREKEKEQTDSTSPGDESSRFLRAVNTQQHSGVGTTGTSAAV